MSDIADQAPNVAALTDYDRTHVTIYLRLLDAEASGANWEEAAQLLLSVDPKTGRDTARLRYETHARRARWMAQEGYLQLLRTPRG